MNPRYLALGNLLTAQATPANIASANNIIPGIRLPFPTFVGTISQSLRPFPQYQNLVDGGGYVGNSSYHSFQARGERRFGGGGTLLGSYTFSKISGDVETATPWLEGGGTGGIQNFNNLRLEKSLSSFDARHRLTVSYVLDLPFGKNARFLSNAAGAVNQLVSGWRVNGGVSLQEGFPVNLTVTPNNTNSQGGGSRPNVIAGCEKKRDGAIQSRLTQYFNTSCFTVPALFAFGTQARTDPTLRGPGIANYDFALSKTTAITERYSIEFRGEVFNVFNRVQFAMPNRAATTAANSTFGQITATANDPRLIQLAIRLKF